MKMFGKGWYNDNWRHSLAAKGIKTNLFSKRSSFYYDVPFDQLMRKAKDLEEKLKAAEKDAEYYDFGEELEGALAKVNSIKKQLNEVDEQMFSYAIRGGSEPVGDEA